MQFECRGEVIQRGILYHSAELVLFNRDRDALGSVIEPLLVLDRLGPIVVVVVGWLLRGRRLSGQAINTIPRSQSTRRMRPDSQPRDLSGMTFVRAWINLGRGN